MNTVQSHRAHVLNLCYSIIEACSLTDIYGLKQQAELIVKEMGEEIGTKLKNDLPEEWGDLL